MRKHILFYLLAVVLLSACAKSRMKDHPEWAKYYEAHHINNACFMMFDNNHESVHYYNKERCLRRYLPCSTFNLFNSLVALETNVAPDDNMVIKWDSTVRQRAEWNKDLTLREAVSAHAIPYFQALIRRIGAVNMQHYLDTVHYGNMKMGEPYDACWLNNSLQISADEQLGLMKRLYFHELPFSERAQRIVRSMMNLRDSGDYKIYYYTGAGTPDKDSMIYWVIGFAERTETVNEDKNSMNKTGVRTYPYFFAQNFSVHKDDTLQDWGQIRLEILNSVLKDYGAIH